MCSASSFRMLPDTFKLVNILKFWAQASQKGGGCLASDASCAVHHDLLILQAFSVLQHPVWQIAELPQLGIQKLYLVLHKSCYLVIGPSCYDNVRVSASMQ